EEDRDRRHGRVADRRRDGELPGKVPPAARSQEIEPDETGRVEGDEGAPVERRDEGGESRGQAAREEQPRRQAQQHDLGERGLQARGQTGGPRGGGEEQPGERVEQVPHAAGGAVTRSPSTGP